MSQANYESQKNLIRAKSKHFDRLGANIKNARKGRGISQVSLAKLADIDRSYISQLENGLVNPTFLLLLSLAAALQVPLLSLIDIE
jgi:transcriptional regulator with XRE-family HTH domain